MMRSLSYKEFTEISRLLKHWTENCGWDFRSIRPWLSRRYNTGFTVEELKEIYEAEAIN